MTKIWLVSWITIKEGIRNRALHGILFLALCSFCIYVTILPLFAFDTGKVAVDLGFASMTISGLAIVIFLGIGMLTKDIHQRTVCMILCRPISRVQYVIGKYIGLSLIILIAVLITSLLAIMSTWAGIIFISEIRPPRNFSWIVLCTGIILNYLSLLIIMAIAFLFTVLTTNAYLSMLFTFCVYLIGNSLETIIKVLAAGEFFQAGKLYLMILKIFAWLFPNLSAFDIKVSIAYGFSLSFFNIFWTVVYGLFYIFIIIYITKIIFSYKEIK